MLCWVWVRVSERVGWDGGGRVVVDVKREPSIRRAFNGCTENKQLPDRVLDWLDWLGQEREGLPRQVGYGSRSIEGYHRSRRKEE